jgi:hypothetical protein
MINGGQKKGGDNKYGEKGEAGRGVNAKERRELGDDCQEYITF